MQQCGTPEVARDDQKDPARALEMLEDFEAAAKGMDGEEKLLGEAKTGVKYITVMPRSCM